VELIDGGAGGLNLLNLFDQADAILAVDAADMGLTTGEFRWVLPRQVCVEQARAFSLHDSSFAQTLFFAEQFFSRPATVIFAVQVGPLQAGMQLSADLERALPRLQDRLLKALRHWAARSAGAPSEQAAETDPDMLLAQMLAAEMASDSAP